MRETGAAGGAIVVAIGAPLIIGSVVVDESEPAPDKPPDAVELVIELTDSTEGSSELAIEAEGDPPEATVLRDDSGTNVATVSPLESGCEDVTTRRLGISEADQTWCLSVEGAAPGSELTGTFRSPTDGATPIAVTLSKRHTIVKPVLVLVLTTLVAVVAAVVPGVLAASNREAAITRLIRANRARPTGESVEGLGRLNEGLRAAKPKAADRLAIIRPIVRHGPGVARAKRAALQERLQGGTGHIPPGHRALAEARAEAVRTDHRTDDFVKNDGTAVAHPADRWGGTISELDAGYARLGEYVREARGLPTDAASHGEITKAQNLLAAIDDPNTDFAAVAEQLDAVVAALGTDGVRILAAAGEPGVPAAPTALSDYLGERPSLALGLTIIVLVVVVAVSITSTMVNVWLPSPTFATLTDYAKLVTTGMATGAAATIVALLSAWFGIDEAG